MAAEFQADLHAAIQFYAAMSQLVDDDDYDACHAPILKARVCCETAARITVVKGEGFKGDPGKN